MKCHYWFISLEVYKDGSGMGFIGESSVTSKGKFLSKKNIEDVRQHFLDYAISEGCPKDVSVHIKSISYLGEMTQEEWEL